jgi:hypothetical protein
MREPGRITVEVSAKLREELIVELNELGTSDEAARWAKRRYPDKTTRLNAADAEHVDQCFRTKLLSFAAHDAEGADADIGETSLDPAVRPNEQDTKTARQPEPIDKGTLSFPEPRRIRDRGHVRHVANQSCLVCGRKPCDAHHLRFAQTRALGRKVSDEFTVPLCRGHHRELHRYGDEAKWWKKIVIDPLPAARALWLETHPLTDEAAPIASEASGLVISGLADQKSPGIPSDNEHTGHR